MLLVKTKIKSSKIHGIGLFANQFIPKGTLVWKFIPNLDNSIDKSKFKKLSKLAKKTILYYGWLDKKENKYILDFDDARFLNHSNNPNTIQINNSDNRTTPLVAKKNINKGQELTCNYEEFALDKVYKKNY